uniref:Uncharacterized protein n=1 Tax=Anguilla anguilla TaxID=7936 RepID=A0A0E9RTU2_ANGAN
MYFMYFSCFLLFYTVLPECRRQISISCKCNGQ